MKAFALGLALAIVTGSLTSLHAQQIAGVAPDSAAVRCVGCGGPKRFRRAAEAMFGSELIPQVWNRWIAGDPTARVGIHSWESNLEHGWAWDPDHFGTNQFGHPYGGNLFFNSARSNGYSFWGSAPFAMAGSLTWEYFGETNRPSINDLANTTLGGITIGEITYRLSSLMLDNRSTGARRVFGEIGAALVDPVRAFSRLLDGQIGRVGPNPADRLPSQVRGSVALGYQHLDRGPLGATVRLANQGFTFVTVAYGDPLAGDVTHPFGAFQLEAEFATPGPGMLSQLRLGGALAVHDLKRSERANQQLLLAMHYHYYNNQAFESGGQGFSGALVSRYPVGKKSSLRTELWLTGFALAAIKSDYGVDSATVSPHETRNYDYGPGVGGRVLARFDHGTRWFIDLAYQAFSIDVLNGAAHDHFYQTLSSVWQIRVHGNLAVGERDLVYRRTSHYPNHPETHTRDAQVQIFLALGF